MPETPTVDELISAGVKVRPGFDPITRDYDLLERYRLVPNHAMFLYTSEDSVLDKYIREHWAALDGLSGDICDIHVSLVQLVGGADAYSQFDEIKTIPGLETMNADDLPALHIWSKEASIRFFLNPYKDDTALRDVFRIIFSELKKNDSPLTELQAKDIKSKILTNFNPTRINGQVVLDAVTGRDIIQITNNYFNSEKAMSDQNNVSGETKQIIESVKLTGGIKQTSDAVNTKQEVKKATAFDLEQTAKSEKQNLILGKYQASGKWAVIGLVLVVIILVFFKFVGAKV